MNGFVISCPYKTLFTPLNGRSAFVQARILANTYRCAITVEDLANEEIFHLTWRRYPKRPLLRRIKHEELGEWRATGKDNPIIACANGHPYEDKNIYLDRRTGYQECYTCKYNAVPRLKGVE